MGEGLPTDEGFVMAVQIYAAFILGDVAFRPDIDSVERAREIINAAGESGREALSRAVRFGKGIPGDDF